MRLFLSSEDFGRYPQELVKLVGKNKKTIFINNAKDYATDDDRSQNSHENIAELTELGLEVEEIDLRHYFDKSQKLADKLQGYGLVWCSGGITFLLRRAMADSGLDKILVDLLDKDLIVYGGSSAGSVVMAPSLRGVELADDSSAVKAIYGKEIIWEGLGMIDIYLVPHYGSDWFSAESEAMAGYLKQHSLPYQTLQDGQVYLVDGQKQQLLT